MNSNYVYTSNEFGKDADLGFSFQEGAGKGATIGGAAGTVVPGVGNAVGAGVGTIIGGVASFFGGGKKYSDCGAKQLQAAEVFRTLLTPADLQQIAADARQNVGDLTGSTADDLAFHYLGGDDCETTSSEGRAWKARVDALLQKRQQEKQQAVQAANGSSSGVVSSAGLGKSVLIGGSVLGLGLIVAAMAK